MCRQINSCPLQNWRWNLRLRSYLERVKVASDEAKPVDMRLSKNTRANLIAHNNFTISLQISQQIHVGVKLCYGVGLGANEIIEAIWSVCEDETVTHPATVFHVFFNFTLKCERSLQAFLRIQFYAIVLCFSECSSVISTDRKSWGTGRKNDETLKCRNVRCTRGTRIDRYRPNKHSAPPHQFFSP